MLPVRCRFTDKCWNIYERRWMANSNTSLSRGNWPLKKKKVGVKLRNFFCMIGETWQLRREFCICQVRLRAWVKEEKALTNPRSQLQSTDFIRLLLTKHNRVVFQRFYGYKWYQKIIKLAYVIAESSNYTFYTRGFLTIAALCPFPGFALGILP